MVSPVDFGIAERVWDNIRDSSRNEFPEQRRYVEEEFAKLATTLSRYCTASPADEGERLRVRFEVSLAVSQFVSRAFAFYANIRQTRAFSPQEMVAGKELPLLLGQGMALIQGDSDKLNSVNSRDIMLNS
jgi:hypothetical protein